MLWNIPSAFYLYSATVPGMKTFPTILLILLVGCKQATTKIIDTYANGQTETEYIYPDKSDTSKYTLKVYYETGKLKHKTEVVNGMFVGDKISYHANGVIERIERLTHPTALDDAKYDCHITIYRPDGTKESDYIYENGTVNGIATDYDSTGNIARTTEYIDGKVNGVSTLYYLNGKTKSIAHIKNDSAYGFQYEFSETGDTLKAEVHYGFSVQGVFYKKWLPNRLILTGSYGDSDRTYVIWKWLDKNGIEIRHKVDSGTLVDNDYKRFIAPD